MDIKKFKEIIDKVDLSFKRFEGWFNWNPYTCRFFSIELLPSIGFFVDNQFNETFVTCAGDLFEAHVGIGFDFSWLGLGMGFQINFKTNKPLSNETTT